MNRLKLILVFVLVSISTVQASKLPRCDAAPAPNPDPKGDTLCDIYIDGKLHSRKPFDNKTCFCPPESELPPKVENSKSPITIAPVFAFSKKDKKSEGKNINTYIDGNKKKKINFACVNDAQGIVDEKGSWTGAILCKIMSKNSKGKLIPFAEIKFTDEDEFLKKCNCVEGMEIPLASLTTQGMKDYNAIVNPTECKVIDKAVSKKTDYQYCRLEIDGKEKIYFGTDLNTCEEACNNYKEACSVGDK